MKNIEQIDFYSAFEEDDGLEIFINSDECSKRILIWEYFYREIMKRLEPMIDDDLNDLIRCYDEALSYSNVNNQPCQVLNLEIILLQLQNALYPEDTRTNLTYYDAENRIITEMISLISEAIDKNLSVYVKRIEG